MTPFFDRRGLPVTALSGMCALGLSLTACTIFPEAEVPSIDSPTAKLAAEAKAELKSLNVAVIPWQNSAEHEAKLQELAAYLSEQLSIPVNIELTDSYDATVDLLVNGQVHMASLGAFTYLQARDRNPNVEPIVVAIDKDSGRPWYTSVMVVRADSGITSLEDAAGKRFSFVSDSSTSGFLVPTYNFQQMGIVPEEYFASVEFSGGHNTSIERLVAGEVDAIVTESLNFDRESQPGGLLASGDYQVVWESEPIPNGPIVISSEIPDAVKIELQKVLIDAPEGLMSASGGRSAGYTVAEDADYDSIRALKQAMGL